MGSDSGLRYLSPPSAFIFGLLRAWSITSKTFKRKNAYSCTPPNLLRRNSGLGLGTMALETYLQLE